MELKSSFGVDGLRDEVVGAQIKRMKARKAKAREFLVTISPDAVEIVKPRLAAVDGPLLFPAIRTTKGKATGSDEVKPTTPTTIRTTAATSREWYATPKMPCPLCGNEEATVNPSPKYVKVTLVECPYCTTYELDAAFERDPLPDLDAETKRRLAKGLVNIDRPAGALHRLTVENWKTILMSEDD